jgi:dTDP-4-amino-4,6-dideoxy-D-glucose ammonia-lyase
MRLGYKHEKDQIEANRYWNNTISPLLANGSLEHAVEGTYVYPNRIGLYPGMTCQFFCTFCGRNYNAKYKSTDIDNSFEVFKQVIDQDPKEGKFWQDRFRISGGLEPLTNPHIGKIISYGNSQGFNMQMYTNGYALSQNFLEKQQGILDLEVMRISLYGHDQESYYRVTKNKKAFDIVTRNLKDFCRKVPTTGSKIKLGVNWIILPGHSEDVRSVFRMIKDINSVFDFKISFVTLREDFSQSNNYISDEEREKLHKIFIEVEQETDVHIDYGYALHSVRHGRPTGPIQMATHEQMDRHGWPQIATSVDSLGNLYVYHETGFLDRPGSDRYIIGNIKNSNVADIVKEHLQGPGIKAQPFDVGFLDAFDHTTTLLLHEAKQYKASNLDWKQELEKKWKSPTQT